MDRAERRRALKLAALHRRAVLQAAAGCAAFGAGAAVAAEARIVGYATQSGAVTYDGLGQPGNPYATSFIEALAQRPRTAAEFLEAIGRRTAEITQGRQVPEWAGPLRASFNAQRGARAALILIFSQYEQLNALPGAAHDAVRLQQALSAQGFATQAAVDPAVAELPSILANFESRSREADTALLYCTGHGVEVDGRQFVLTRAFDVEAGADGLRGALAWRDLLAVPRARRTSLALWAGCRDNPFNWRLPADLAV